MNLNINRRKAFTSIVKSSIGVGAVVGSIGTISGGCQTTGKEVETAHEAKAAKPMLMNVGCQHGGTGKKNLEFLARHGVFHMDGGAPKVIEGVGWDLDDSLAKRDACEKYGISLDAYHLPLSSAGIDRIATPNIMLGKSPERDREIEMIQQMIQVASKTGVSALLYNAIILEILRTGRTIDPTRGNASYSTWNYEEALEKGMDKVPVTGGGADIDEIYERITYFLD